MNTKPTIDVERLPLGAYRLDESGRISFISRAGLSLLGADALTEVTGKPLADYLVDANEALAFSDELRRTSPVSRRRMRMFRVNRAEFWAEHYASLDIETGAIEGVFHDISDLVKCELDIANRERQFNGAQRLGHIGSWELDLASRTVTFSDEMARITGVKTGELEMSFDEFAALTLPAERDSFRQKIEQCANEGSTISVEHWILRIDDGKPVALRTLVERTDIEDGRVLLLGTSRDVTGQKESERLLRESERQLAEAEEITSLGSWQWDIITDQIAWSDELYRIFGTAPVDFPASYDSYLRFIHREDRDHTDRVIRRALKDKKPFSFEHRIVRPDGTERLLQGRGRVFLDDSEKPIRMIGTALDITDRRSLEESLQEQQTRLRLLTTKLPAIIWSTDTDLRITSASGAGLVALGHDSHQAIGMTLNEYLRTEDPAAPSFLAHEAALAGESATFEIEYRDRVFHAHLEPLRDRAERITGTVGVALDITERKSAEQRVEHLAFHDALTELPNWRLFNDRLGLALAHSKRHQLPFALFFLDLDHFNLVNDSLGHEAGDELLKTVALRLTEALREGDTVARASGDEFVILAGDLGSADFALDIAQKILDAIAITYPLDGEDANLTGSMGVAIYPDDGLDAETLLNSAESAMHRAKEAGRNNFQIATPTLSQQATDRLSIENRLRRALERDELVLFYQPEVEIEERRIVGYEALLRWKRPDGSFIQPVDFIPLAEETRLIIPIGAWVLRTACAEAKLQSGRNGHGARIAVNLSARQFLQRDLAAKVRTVLEEAEVDPTFLELEITESVALQDIKLSSVILRALRDLGVRITMDDFGTGYSSLSYLKALPLTGVKIDRMFVRDILTDPGDAAIVAAVISLAAHFRLEVVAEGVETKEQAGFLATHGCNRMQGFLFSRPMPIDEIGDVWSWM